VNGCQFLQRVQDVTYEVGNGPSPTVFQERWDCRLGLAHMGMDWEQCQRTPYRGPCWQMKKQFQTAEEWEAWARFRLSQP
jgi:hypothetical protein